MSCAKSDQAEAIELYAGDSLDLELHTEWESGEPFDITSWTVRFTVADAGIIKLSTNPSEISKPDPVNGKSLVYLKPADTVDLKPGIAYHYKAEVFTGIDNFTFLEGAFKVF